VQPLAGDVTGDLDMFIWPVGRSQWVVSEYPAGSAQASSIEPTLRILAEREQRVFRVPGLEPIIRDDINTIPNYANGVLLNEAALVPAYGREEDHVIVSIMEGLGFDVFPIDCSEVILSNAGVHCLSKTLPRAIRIAV
jgi:agmatine/peptidylarginine deiminase